MVARFGEEASGKHAILAGGLSPARIERMHDTMRCHVASGRLPGLVTLVSRRDEAHVDAIGTLAFGSGVPMRRDTIFRLASMTKPFSRYSLSAVLAHWRNCTPRGERTR